MSIFFIVVFAHVISVEPQNTCFIEETSQQGKVT